MMGGAVKERVTQVKREKMNNYQLIIPLNVNGLHDPIKDIG